MVAWCSSSGRASDANILNGEVGQWSTPGDCKSSSKDAVVQIHPSPPLKLGHGEVVTQSVLTRSFKGSIPFVLATGLWWNADMLVLETNAEKRESSSLSRPTKNISQNTQNSKKAKWNCRKSRNAKLTVAAYRTVLKTDCSGNWVGIDTSAWRQKNAAME